MGVSKRARKCVSLVFPQAWSQDGKQQLGLWLGSVPASHPEFSQCPKKPFRCGFESSLRPDVMTPQLGMCEGVCMHSTIKPFISSQEVLLNAPTDPRIVWTPTQGLVLISQHPTAVALALRS